MAEWFKAHAWKACVGNTTGGSNPSLSATSGHRALPSSILPPKSFLLGQQRRNDSRAGDFRIGQAGGAAFVREVQRVMINPQRMQQRCVEIVDAHDVLYRLVAELVRRAVDVSLLEPAARRPQ